MSAAPNGDTEDAYPRVARPGPGRVNLPKKAANSVSAPWPAYHAAIHLLLKCGMVPLPRRGGPDGKRPALESWKQYTIKPPSKDDLWDWFVGKRGARRFPALGTVCGGIADSLWVPDIEGALLADHPGLFDQVLAEFDRLGVQGVVAEARANAAVTPSGGEHWFFTVTEADLVPGNTKLASIRDPEHPKADDNGWLLLAETRGEGGFIALPPEQGRSWRGTPGHRVEITFDQLQSIVAAFAVIDKRRAQPVDAKEQRAASGRFDNATQNTASIINTAVAVGTLPPLAVLPSGWALEGGVDGCGRQQVVRPGATSATSGNVIVGDHENAGVWFMHSTALSWVRTDPAGEPAGMTSAQVLAASRYDGDMRVALAAVEQAASAASGGHLDQRSPFAGWPLEVLATVADHRTNRRAEWESQQHSDDSGNRPRSRTVTLTPAASIAPARAKWLWHQRMAVGTIALIAGREGVGKSTLAYWLVAQVTCGTMPGEYMGQPRDVIVCATEDSWEHTIVPRLIAADADLTRVHRVAVSTSIGDTELSLPMDIAAVGEAAREVDAAVLLLDPLMSRLSATLDTHRDAEVRQALEPLTKMLDDTGMVGIGLMHFNKSGSDDPLNALMASRAFAAVARSVSTVVRDPDDDTGKRRLFGTPKNNLGPDDLPLLSFHLTSHAVPTPDGDNHTSRIEWGDEVDDSITEVLRRTNAPGTDRTATQEAADWLEDYLHANGGQADSAKVKRAGHAAGHNDSALQRARKNLRLHTDSLGFPRRTVWRLPGSSLDDTTDEDAPTAPVVSSSRVTHGESEIAETTETTEASHASRVSRVSRDTPPASDTTDPTTRVSELHLTEALLTGDT